MARDRPGRLLLRIALVLVGLSALAWTLRGLGPRRVWEIAGAANPVWVALAVGAVATRFILWAGKWRIMLRRRRDVPYRVCLQYVLAGALVNLTTPTAKMGGGIVRAGLLARRRGWPAVDAYGWALADQATNVLGQWLLFGVLGVTASAGLPPGSLRASLMVGGILACAAVALIGVGRNRLWGFLRQKSIGRLLARLVPSRFRGNRSPDVYDAWLERMLLPILNYGPVTSSYLPDVVFGAMGFSTLCLSNALILRALGAEAPLALVSVAVLGAYLAGTLLGAWGGIGVTEAALAGLFVQIGIPAELAATAALLHRAVFYALTVVGGAPVLLASAGRRRANPSSLPDEADVVGEWETNAG